ncbi:hypothetical protein BDZ89DRAFT_1053320 [Hymenopellis radicata]|nr:hypothetical protein BDZ89DRAFT_1053320 [Hymenopellis radicata]
MVNKDRTTPTGIQRQSLFLTQPTVIRDTETWKVPCPVCGQEAHARFDARVMRNTLASGKHTQDNNYFPDDIPRNNVFVAGGNSTDDQAGMALRSEFGNASEIKAVDDATSDDTVNTIDGTDDSDSEGEGVGGPVSDSRANTQARTSRVGEDVDEAPITAATTNGDVRTRREDHAASDDAENTIDGTDGSDNKEGGAGGQVSNPRANVQARTGMVLRRSKVISPAREGRVLQLQFSDTAESTDIDEAPGGAVSGDVKPRGSRRQGSNSKAQTKPTNGMILWPTFNNTAESEDIDAATANQHNREARVERGQDSDAETNTHADDSEYVTDDTDVSDDEDQWGFDLPPSPKMLPAESHAEVPCATTEEYPIVEVFSSSSSLTRESNAARLLKSVGFIIPKVAQCVVCVNCTPNKILEKPSHIHGHIADTHKIVPRPSQERLFDAILTLGADLDENHFPIDRPIPRLGSVEVIDGVKCMVEGCSKYYTFSRGWYRHWNEAHATTLGALPDPKAEELARKEMINEYSKRVSFFRAGAYRGTFAGHEVLSADTQSDLPPESLLKAVLETFGAEDLHTPLPAGRGPDPYVATCGWSAVLSDVDPRKLRQKVSLPLVEERGLYRLVRYILPGYFKSLIERLPELSWLARRHLRSPASMRSLKYEGLDGHQDLTTDKYTREMGRMLCFCIRHLDEPVDNFAVPMSGDLRDALMRLRTSLESSDLKNAAIYDDIHKSLWLLLTSTSKEAKTRRDQDLYNLYLASAAIRDDSGTLTRANLLTTRISGVQWCLRMTGAQQLLKLRNDTDSDVEIYMKHVIPHLTESDRPTLFAMVREKMHLFTKLTNEMVGNPRVHWDPTHSIITMDGVPIKAVDVYIVAQRGIRALEAQVTDILMGADIRHVTRHIQKRLNPRSANSQNWFIDNPSAESVGSSIFNTTNGFDKFQHVLLSHLCEEKGFFTRVENKPAANADAIWTWIQKLNRIIELAYFLIILTSGGTPRGTESEPLRRQDTAAGPRNLRFFNGLLTLYFDYNKTGVKRILRTPPVVLSKSLLVIWGLLFPTAAELLRHLGLSEESSRYKTYLWVRGGKLLKSDALSKALRFHTDAYFNHAMGNNGIRHFVDALLKHALRDIPGDINVFQEGIDIQSGHSPRIAEKHYALQQMSLAQVSPSLVVSFQYISLQWHDKLGLLPVDYRDALRNSAQIREDRQRALLFTEFEARVKTYVSENIAEVSERNTARMEKFVTTKFEELTTKFEELKAIMQGKSVEKLKGCTLLFASVTHLYCLSASTKVTPPPNSRCIPQRVFAPKHGSAQKLQYQANKYSTLCIKGTVEYDIFERRKGNIYADSTSTAKKMSMSTSETSTMTAMKARTDRQGLLTMLSSISLLLSLVYAAPSILKVLPTATTTTFTARFWPPQTLDPPSIKRWFTTATDSADTASSNQRLGKTVPGIGKTAGSVHPPSQGSDNDCWGEREALAIERFVSGTELGNRHGYNTFQEAGGRRQS